MSTTLADLPLAITDHHASRMLEILWEDGTRHQHPHTRLRSACRCATCEHFRRTGVDMNVAGAGAELTKITPVSDKGLNLGFADGHDRGIYPWAYLRELGDREKGT